MSTTEREHRLKRLAGGALYWARRNGTPIDPAWDDGRPRTAIDPTRMKDHLETLEGASDRGLVLRMIDESLGLCPGNVMFTKRRRRSGTSQRCTVCGVLHAEASSCAVCGSSLEDYP